MASRSSWASAAPCPTGVTVGSTDETIISITDDDVPSVTVSFEESSYTVAEGNSVMRSRWS